MNNKLNNVIRFPQRPKEHEPEEGGEPIDLELWMAKGLAGWRAYRTDDGLIIRDQDGRAISRVSIEFYG